jgi:hypothetical protein
MYNDFSPVRVIFLKKSIGMRQRLFGTMVLGELCAIRTTHDSLNKLPIASLNTTICFDTSTDFPPWLINVMTARIRIQIENCRYLESAFGKGFS